MIIGIRNRKRRPWDEAWLVRRMTVVGGMAPPQWVALRVIYLGDGQARVEEAFMVPNWASGVSFAFNKVKWEQVRVNARYS